MNSAYVVRAVVSSKDGRLPPHVFSQAMDVFDLILSHRFNNASGFKRLSGRYFNVLEVTVEPSASIDQAIKEATAVLREAVPPCFDLTFSAREIMSSVKTPRAQQHGQPIPVQETAPFLPPVC